MPPPPKILTTRIVGTLVVGGLACHLGAHGGGCSVPSYGTGRVLLNVMIISRESPIPNTLMKKKHEEQKRQGYALEI